MDMLAPCLAYAAALAIAAGIPGPGVAALVGQALGGGLRPAMAFLAGLALGDVTYLLVAILGLAALAQSFAPVLLAVKLAGGLYLLYLAVGFWRAPGGLARIGAGGEAPIDDGAAPRPGALRAFGSGYAVTLGNPKTIVFYLALLPSVIDLHAVGAGLGAALAGLTVVVLFAVLTPYAVLAARARHLLTRPATLRRLNRAAGAAIGGAGAVIAGQSMREILRRV